MGGKNGWQDEVWCLVMALPLILCFTPGLQAYAKEGFLILSHDVPIWYQSGFGAALAFAFGKERVAGIVGRILSRKSN